MRPYGHLVHSPASGQSIEMGIGGLCYNSEFSTFVERRCGLCKVI